MLSLSHLFEICGDVNISGMGGFESSHSKLSDSIGMSWSPHESSFDAKKMNPFDQKRSDSLGNLMSEFPTLMFGHVCHTQGHFKLFKFFKFKKMEGT